MIANMKKLHDMGFNATKAMNQIAKDGKVIPHAMRNINMTGGVSALSRIANVARPLGVIGGVVGVGFSVNNIITDYGQGGIQQVNGWDIADASVGMAGLGAAVFLASNPIGWAIAGGATLYFGGRLVYDLATGD